MTQEITGNEPVSAKTAMAMVACAERNLRRANDERLLQYLLITAECDRESIICKIMSVPEIMQMLEDFYGYPMGFAIPQECNH
jgi:hypothetical protein